MVKYKTRPGVVLTEICGSYIIISAKANLKLCPYMTEVNNTSAFLWNKLRNGADEQQLLEAACEEFEVPDPKAAAAAIGEFIKQMLEMNYLLTEEQGGVNEE